MTTRGLYRRMTNAYALGSAAGDLILRYAVKDRGGLIQEGYANRYPKRRARNVPITRSHHPRLLGLLGLGLSEPALSNP